MYAAIYASQYPDVLRICLRIYKIAHLSRMFARLIYCKCNNRTETMLEKWFPVQSYHMSESVVEARLQLK